MRIRHPSISRQKSDELGEQLGLSQWLTRRLYCELSQARAKYDFWNKTDQVSVPNAQLDALKRIEKNIGRIARFSGIGTRPETDLLKLLANIGEELIREADASQKSELIDHFALSPALVTGSGDIDYGMQIAVINWFRSAPHMLDIATKAKKVLEQKGLSSKATARSELVARLLPQIHKRLTGKPLRAGYNAYSDSNEYYGPEFIDDAMMAMDLGPMNKAAFVKARSRRNNK